MKKKLQLLLCLLMLQPLLMFSQTQQIAAFSGGARNDAVGFSIGNYGYVGLGQNDSVYFADLWKYDPSDNSWTEVEGFPGDARSGAIAFVIGEYAYVGLGYIYSGGSQYFSDLYRYSPADNEWDQILDFAGGARCYAVAFTIDGAGFVGTGSTSTGQVKDFWRYNPDNNSWTQVADAPEERVGAAGFTINGKGYLVAGIKYTPNTFQMSDVQEYDPIQDEWTERVFADGINLSLNYAATFALNGVGYIAYGNKNHVTSYNPANNNINNLGDLLGISDSRDSPVSFTIDNVAYIGLGYSNVYHNTFWSYSPPPPAPSAFIVSGGGSYCTGDEPTGVNVELSGSETFVSYQLFKDGSSVGEPVLGTGSKLTWEDLTAGNYTVQGTNASGTLAMNGNAYVNSSDYVTVTISIDVVSEEVCEGDLVTITTSTNWEGSSPTYEWMVNDQAQEEQNHTLSYIPSNGDVVSCILTSSYECVVENPAQSNAITFTVTECISSENESTLSVQTANESGFSIYPNPAQSTINIMLPENLMDASLTIYTLDGRTMVSKTLKSYTKEITLNIGDLPAGSYIIHIKGSSFNKTTLFMKE